MVLLKIFLRILLGLVDFCNFKFKNILAVSSELKFAGDESSQRQQKEQKFAPPSLFVSRRGIIVGHATVLRVDAEAGYYTTPRDF